MTATTSIADGIYFLHPEGSSWTAAQFRGGRMVDWTDGSESGRESVSFPT